MGWYRRLISYGYRGFNSKIAQESGSFRPNSRRSGLLKNFNLVDARFYYVDRHKIEHFKPRGWFHFHNPMDLITVALLGSLGCALYVVNLETVPYTNRRRLVLLPSHLEKRIGDSLFEARKSGKFKGKILPASDPDNIRVQKIAHDIIGATRKALRKDRRSQTKHLDEFQWEVIVVDDPIDNAFCGPAGKIIVNTGLLRKLKADAEIAFIIGHEVGHAVARHYAENFSGILRLLILDLFMSDLAPVSEDLLRLSCSRRNESEADYIGLLLSASAGYDPRVATEMLKEMGSSLGFRDYLSTHPPGDKRSQQISDPKVMEEALSRYREARHQTSRLPFVLNGVLRIFGFK